MNFTHWFQEFHPLLHLCIWLCDNKRIWFDFDNVLACRIPKKKKNKDLTRKAAWYIEMIKEKHTLNLGTGSDSSVCLDQILRGLGSRKSPTGGNPES